MSTSDYFLFAQDSTIESLSGDVSPSRRPLAQIQSNSVADSPSLAYTKPASSPACCLPSLPLQDALVRVVLVGLVDVADNSGKIGLRVDDHDPVCHETLHFLQMLGWRKYRR